MKRSAILVLVLLAAILLPVSLGCNKLKARREVSKAREAYRHARYDDAIQHFNRAVELDPSLSLVSIRNVPVLVGRSSCIPGVDSSENIRNCYQEIEKFKKELAKYPGDIGSLKGVASLYFNMASGASKPEDKVKYLDEAKKYHAEVIKNDPSGPEAYYSVAAIDWTEAYKNRVDAMSAAGQVATGDESFKDKKVCKKVKDKNDPLIQEGLDDLNKALELRKDYDDAMAYLNLIYRQKADIECGDAQAYKVDISTADYWLKKMIDTRRAKAARQQGPGGVVLDQKKRGNP